MMGENGTGKTTFCKMLAGALQPDGDTKIPKMSISMKPQTITPKFQGTVRQLFFKKIKAAFLSPQFQTDVYKPLKMDDFIDQEVQNLSGGELQRVAIVLALGMPADIYRPPTSTLSSVSSPRASSSASSCTPRRPLSSSSTISSWPPTLPIVSLSSMVSLLSTPVLALPNPCFLAATPS